MRDSRSKDLGFTPFSHLETTVCLSNLRRDVFDILATPLHRLERLSGFADYVSLSATSQAHSPISAQSNKYKASWNLCPRPTERLKKRRLLQKRGKESLHTRTHSVKTMLKSRASGGFGMRDVYISVGSRRNTQKKHRSRAGKSLTLRCKGKRADEGNKRMTP